MPTPSWSVLTVDSLMRQYPLLSDHPYLSDCWNYESGCLLLAIARLYERTGSQAYLTYIRKNIDAYVADNGSIRSYTLNDYNLDQVNQGKVLLFLHQQTGADNYMQAAHLLI